jgi:hypothetical protein
MRSSDRIKVMISSRCNDSINFSGKKQCLSDVRRQLKTEIESEALFGKHLFDVWINEDAPPSDASDDSWNTCLNQVRSAEIVLVLFNGNSGWAKDAEGIGICHAELMAAMDTAPAKVRLIELPKQSRTIEPDSSRDQRFREYIATRNLFRGKVANNGEEAIDRAKEAIADAAQSLVRLGIREARKGKFDTGEALQWSRLSLADRKEEMERTVLETLGERSGSTSHGDHVSLRLGNQQILIRHHGIPAAMTNATAREMVGQPFLYDYQFANLLSRSISGPIHLIACSRGVTEAQAIRQLGFPDATFVTTPFGVYVADDVQKIQIVFVAQCRDSTTTRHGLQRMFDWLEQSGETDLMAKRAKSRKRIVKLFQREINE